MALAACVKQTQQNRPPDDATLTHLLGRLHRNRDVSLHPVRAQWVRSHMNPEAVVQFQLDAYNARDLDRFLAAYSDEARIFRPPDPAAFIVAKPALAEYYATQRFNLV